MSSTRLVLRTFFSSCFSFALAATAIAQVTSVTNSTSTPNQGIGHDYIHMLNETVNPANGAVSLRIEASVPPGRRLTLPFSFNYDSNAATAPSGDGYGGAYLGPTTSGYLQLGGWSYGLPIASNVQVSNTVNGYPCNATAGYVFLDSSGTRYSFNSLVGFEQAPRECVGMRDKTSDYTNDFYFGGITGYASPLTVQSVDDTVYTFNFGPSGGCGADLEDPGYTLPATIEDRNGNIISISGPPTTCNGSFTATDTLGRAVLSSSGFGATGNTITVSGFSQPYRLTWGTASSHFSPGFTSESSSNPYCSNTMGDLVGGTVVTAITLPNGKQYTFSYDPTYGLLSKITYPGGGYISYTWGPNHRSDFTTVVDSNGDPQTCDYTYDNLAVTHRYVSFDGSTVALQQDFTYSTTWNPNDFSSWTSKQTTVTTRDLIQGITYQTVYTYAAYTPLKTFSWLPTSFGNQVPVEQTIVYKDTNGNTLRTVNKTWFDQYEIATDQTVLETGQTSKVAYTWAYGGISEKDEYDFGQSTPTRKTVALLTSSSRL